MLDLSLFKLIEHSSKFGIEKIGPKINKPVPRHRPKMQITMGKWDKQGQKEAQNQ